MRDMVEEEIKKIEDAAQRIIVKIQEKASKNQTDRMMDFWNDIQSFKTLALGMAAKKDAKELAA